MALASGSSCRSLVASILRRHRKDPSRLLQILIDIQEDLHGVPEPAVAMLARELPGHSRLSVQAVIAFYAFLSPRFLGEYVIRLSDGVTDRLQGGTELAAALCARLGVALGQVRDDGRVSVHATSCTGMADQGPAGLVNGLAVTALTPARIEAMAGLVAQGRPLAQWPPEWFRVAPNIRRAGPLLGLPLAPGAALRACLARGRADLDRAAAATLEELHRSGLRGRGGAGFQVAAKWAAARDAPGAARSILCNADEGEPGTFKDRVLLQVHPDLVVEGMTLAGLCVGASLGVLYVRGEYRYLKTRLEAVLERRRRSGLLGRGILGTALDFDIQLHWGAGAYICGMETAMIESIEGKPGIPRRKWPLPVFWGLDGDPSVVNNVESFAAAAQIGLRGGSWFAAQGTAPSTGSKLFCVAGDCRRPGLYEYPWGVPLGALLEASGAGAVQAAQVSGPSGSLVGPGGFGRRLAYEDLGGVGSVTVFGPDRDLLEVLLAFARFFRLESCGLCTPCRVGTALLVDLLEKFRAGRGAAEDLERILALGQVMRTTSHCGLGQTAAGPALDAAAQFPALLRGAGAGFQPAFDPDQALAEARALAGRDDPDAHL